MVKIHGKYCGPNWTSGKVLAAKDATTEDFKVKPTDDLDAACRLHDLAINKNGNSYRTDQALEKRARAIRKNKKYSKNIRLKAEFIEESMARLKYLRGRF